MATLLEPALRKPHVHHPEIPGIAVVIPVANPAPHLHAALDALADSEDRPDELILVIDGDVDEIGPWPEEARVLSTGHRSGPARARNVGALAATRSILLFLDADVAVHADVVARVRRALEGDPELAAVIGSYDDSPGAEGFISQYRNLLHHYVHQTGSPEASTFWGACGAIRRSVFLDAGGFDERYERPSIEDIELGYRLKAAGHRLRLDRDLQVKHLKRWTISGMLRTDVVDRALPWTELLLRRRRAEADLNLDVRSRVSVVAALVLPVAAAAALAYAPATVAALVAAILLLALNAPFYLFLARVRTPAFAVRAVPWHWLYFVYGGVAFAVGWIRHVFRKRRDGVSRVEALA